jgi:hypothetical protein
MLLPPRDRLSACLGFRGFTKHIDPVSLSFGVRDLDAPRFSDAIEFYPRSQTQKHEDARRDER